MTGSSPSLPDTADIALRVEGLHDTIDSLDFGACEVSWWGLPKDGFDPAEFAELTSSAHVRTVRLDVDWHEIQFGGLDSWSYTNLDSSLRFLDSAAGCRILGLLTQVPDWASSRFQVNDTTHGTTWCYRSPPRRLEYSAADTNNYLVRYLRHLIAHCDSCRYAIHDWEVGNEVNSEDSVDPGASWWVHPNFYYTGDSAPHVGPGLHDMCALYVRYAMVVDSAVHAIQGHEADRIAVNSVNWVNDTSGRFDSRGPIYAGRDWLREFYGLVNGKPPFWDAISAHPYQETLPPSPPKCWPFEPRSLEAHAETLRSIMRQYGDYGELWNTEHSMPGSCWWDSSWIDSTVSTPEQEADYCCETFTTAEGMKGLPGGCFDRNYWWKLRAADMLEHEGLVWAHGNCPNVPLWAFKQTAERLTGKRLNGRVLTGDTAIDARSRMYEFEDPATSKKTWVCWSNKVTAPPISVTLPARSDTTFAVALDYGDHSSPNSSYADADGWLRENLGTRPIFIAEKSNPSRPDLVVDSVKYILQAPNTVLAWVTNRGNRATPRQSPGNQPYPTWAVLCANGDSLTQQVCTDSIGVNQQVTFKFNLGIAQPSSVLLTVKVNPAQIYVELGTDDNAGYVLKP
ncbi:MAG TPA: hypothetical protein VMH22_10265 [bacterium]|nr:hypothetical protein [bacterium]